MGGQDAACTDHSDGEPRQISSYILQRRGVSGLAAQSRKGRSAAAGPALGTPPSSWRCQTCSACLCVEGATHSTYQSSEQADIDVRSQPGWRSWLPTAPQHIFAVGHKALAGCCHRAR